MLQQAGLLPRWVALLSYLMAAAMLVTTTLHPALLLVFPGWVALAGLIVLARTGRSGVRTAPRSRHMTTTRTDADPLEDIPGPRPLPLLGNAFDIDRADPLGASSGWRRSTDRCSRLSTPGGIRLFVSGPDLVDEVCDDARFDKKVAGGLANLRREPTATACSPPTPTTRSGARAHNILMTPFSLQAMRDYMPQDARHRRPADGQVGAA